MSNYAKITDFASKDALATGTPAKAVKGAEIDAEFSAIATMSGTKADTSMTAAFLLANGSAPTPSLAFVSEPGTGLYRAGAGDIRFAVGGADNLKVAAASFTAPAFIPSSATVPSNGMYLSAANTVAVSSNTTARGTVNGTGNWTLNAPSSGTLLSLNAAAAGTALSATDGTVTATATFAGTAFSLGPTSAHTLNLATNGSNRVAVNSAGNVTVNAPSSGTPLSLNAAAAGTALSATDGTVTATATFAGTAFSLGPTSAHTLNLATNGSNRVAVNSAGNVTCNAPSSGVALTVQSSTGNLAANFVGSTNFDIIGLHGSSTNGSGFRFRDDLNSADRGYIGYGPNTITGASISDLCISAASGSLRLGYNSGGSTSLTINSNGTVTINAPAANTAALTVNGSAATPANSIGNSGTAFTVDCAKSNVHYVTMTGNVAAGAMTISNMQDGQTINIYLTQDATGNRTLGNATGVKWQGGTVGVLSTAANALDCITIQLANGIKTATILKAFA